MDFTVEKLLGQFCASVHFHFLCYLDAVQLEGQNIQVTSNWYLYLYTLWIVFVLYFCDPPDTLWNIKQYLLNCLNNRILAAGVKHPLFYWHRVARHRVDEHWRKGKVTTLMFKLSDSEEQQIGRHLCFLRSRLRVCVWIGTDGTWWEKQMKPGETTLLCQLR